MFKSVSVT